MNSDARISVALLGIVFVAGCASTPEFDASLLEPEISQKNIPLDVEPFADPDVLTSLAPIRAQFDNLAFTEDSPTVNPRMTTFAKQQAKTIYEPVQGKAFLMSGWQLTCPSGGPSSSQPDSPKILSTKNTPNLENVRLMNPPSIFLWCAHVARQARRRGC